MSEWPVVGVSGEPNAGAREGRPSSLTLARIEQLSDLLSGGNTIGNAARFSGISEASYFSWRHRGLVHLDYLESHGVDIPAALGEDLTPKALFWRPAAAGTEWIYLVFAVVMDRSRAAGAIRAVHAIQTAAANGDWRAAAWFLEHTQSQDYGSRLAIQLETPDPLAVEHTVITVDSVSATLAALAAQNGTQHHAGRQRGITKEPDSFTEERDRVNQFLKEHGVPDGKDL